MPKAAAPQLCGAHLGQGGNDQMKTAFKENLASLYIREGGEKGGPVCVLGEGMLLWYL